MYSIVRPMKISYADQIIQDTLMDKYSEFYLLSSIKLGSEMRPSIKLMTASEKTVRPLNIKARHYTQKNRLSLQHKGISNGY